MRQMRRCAARACMSLGLCVLCETREVGKERSEKCHGRRGERARCGGFNVLPSRKRGENQATGPKPCPPQNARMCNVAAPPA